MRACGPVSVYVIPRTAFILLLLGPVQDTVSQCPLFSSFLTLSNLDRHHLKTPLACLQVSSTIQHYAEVDPTHPGRMPKVCFFLHLMLSRQWGFRELTGSETQLTHSQMYPNFVDINTSIRNNAAYCGLPLHTFESIH